MKNNLTGIVTVLVLGVFVPIGDLPAKSILRRVAEVAQVVSAPVTAPIQAFTKVANGNAPSAIEIVPVLTPNEAVLLGAASVVMAPAPVAPQEPPSPSITAPTAPPANSENIAPDSRSVAPPPVAGGVLPAVLALKAPISAVLYGLAFLVLIAAFRTLFPAQKQARQ